MRKCTLMIFARLAGAGAACHKGQQQAQEQNISIDDASTSNGIPANADVETLPPDESSETPSTELPERPGQSRRKRPERVDQFILS